MDGNEICYNVAQPFIFVVSNLKDIFKCIQNDNTVYILKYNNTKMKRDLGYIYREPQIILQRAECGSRAAGWPPLLYSNIYT